MQNNFSTDVSCTGREQAKVVVSIVLHSWWWCFVVVFQSLSQCFRLKWTGMEMAFNLSGVSFHMELEVVFIKNCSMDTDYCDS